MTHPQAVDDTYTVAEDTTLNIAAPGVLSNDTDVDGNSLTVIKVSDPANGTLTLNTNGSFTYIPAANWNGADSFTYVANDGTEDSNIATVSITVAPVNDPPVAADDSYATAEDTPLTIIVPGVLGNDTDADGDPLTAVNVSDPAHGSLTLNSDGSFTYIPAANWNGPDSFTYRANDGLANSNTATVSLTINSVNDAPVAVDDTAQTIEGVAVTVSVLANDSDVDADTLSVSAVSTPGHGTAVISDGATTVIYTPGSGYSGPDSFTYTVTDGQGGTATATVSVTVLPDLIFADGFESGNLSYWSSAVTDGGDLAVLPAAALVGSQGLSVTIDDNNPMYVVDNSPSAETHYRYRFYFDPNTIPMASQDTHFIFKAIGSSGEASRMYMYYYQNNYYIVAQALDNGNVWRSTSPYLLSDQKHFIEVDWLAASTTAGTDGALALWVDDAQVRSLSGVANGNKRVDEVWLGPYASIDNGTTGHVLLGCLREPQANAHRHGRGDRQLHGRQHEGDHPARGAVHRPVAGQPADHSLPVGLWGWRHQHAG